MISLANNRRQAIPEPVRILLYSVRSSGKIMLIGNFEGVERMFTASYLTQFHTGLACSLNGTKNANAFSLRLQYIPPLL